MIHSDKKQRKIRTDEMPLSDKLVKTRRYIQVWNLVMNHKERNRLSTRVTRRKANKSGLTRVLAESLPSAKLKLSRVWKDYKESKNMHTVYAMNFLLDREDKAESEKSKIEIRIIRRHEKTFRSWRVINRS